MTSPKTGFVLNMDKLDTQMEQYICSSENLSLERLDRSIEDMKKKESELLCRLRQRIELEGIDLSVINECIRIPVEKRTELEKRIVLQDRVQRMMENTDIQEQLEAQLLKVQTCLVEWVAIREKFTSMYPQATTSPRLSRPQLETPLQGSPRTSLQSSPTRTLLLQGSPRTLMEKSKSTSSLTSSPPRNLRVSGKVSNSASSITSVNSAPAKVTKKETY